MSGNLDLGRLLAIPVENGSLCLNCSYSVIYAGHVLFSGCQVLWYIIEGPAPCPGAKAEELPFSGRMHTGVTGVVCSSDGTGLARPALDLPRAVPLHLFLLLIVLCLLLLS